MAKIKLTAIEYVVVAILLLILGIIAFPSLLSSGCGNRKISQPEGERYTATIARVQQAHYIEFGTFTKQLSRKMFGIPESTENYQYSMVTAEDEVLILGQAKSKELRSYRGYVWLDDETNKTMSIVCATQQPGMPAQTAVRDVRNFDQPCESNRNLRC